MNQLTGKITLDFRSDEPIYLQIARQVEQLVTLGELKLGDQLPTVRQMAQDLRVNFNTIARAYRLLDEAGIISTQQGRGTYILDVPPPERIDKLRQQALEVLTRDYLSEAHHLGCSPNEITKTLKEQLENENNT